MTGEIHPVDEIRELVSSDSESDDEDFQDASKESAFPLQSGRPPVEHEVLGRTEFQASILIALRIDLDEVYSPVVRYYTIYYLLPGSNRFRDVLHRL